jgi:hypothetical protein
LVTDIWKFNAGWLGHIRNLLPLVLIFLSIAFGSPFYMTPFIYWEEMPGRAKVLMMSIFFENDEVRIL